MATLEIGTPAKSVRYINVHQEGKSEGQFCSVDSRWSSPQLDKQSDYLVAISRFEVPLNRIPVTAKMDNCIQIFRYNDFADADGDGDVDGDDDDFKGGRGDLVTDGIAQNVEVGALLGGEQYLSREDGIGYLDACEALPHLNYTLRVIDPNDPAGTVSAPGAHSIDMPPCFTIFDFLSKLNAQIIETLVMNDGPRMFAPTDENGLFRSLDQDAGNLFTTQNGISVCSRTEPIANFSITMSSDFTFSVNMNHAFAKLYYLKMSTALFNMLQFKEIVEERFKRANLPGRRFMGDRLIYGTGMYLANLQTSIPPYIPIVRSVICILPTVGSMNAPPVNATLLIDLGAGQFVSPYTTTMEEFQTHFTAPISAADSINRIKSIVFRSSLATTSEATTGNTFRRLLTDFTIPVQSQFSWDPNTGYGGSVGENAASEYTFANANPSGGRFLMMSDPSPLYELKLEVQAKCWDFERSVFTFEPIPLPMGSTFTCKLVFISKNDIHQRERPDALKG